MQQHLMMSLEHTPKDHKRQAQTQVYPTKMRAEMVGKMELLVVQEARVQVQMMMLLTLLQKILKRSQSSPKQ